MKYPVLTLKPGRDVHVRNRHHAIYKNAFTSLDGVETGVIAEVRSSDGDFLCYATINTKAYIAGRAIAFEEGDPLGLMSLAIRRAVKLRSAFFQNSDTIAYRLINAEGDSLPGLIVDRYGDTLVLQATTLGMDRLRGWIADELTKIVGALSIYEKSSGSSRKSEGLEPREGWMRENGPEEVTFKERGLTYKISLSGSQKTGFFLDQREMRSIVRSLAPGRTVLDCCSYVGGFSVSALAGGAASADAVDYDAAALERAKEHVKINGIAPEQFQTFSEDVFDFLRRRPLPREYDLIVLDPPAFAKRSSDTDQAKGAYTDLNRMAMQALCPGGLLLTCSCSYQIDHALFQTIVFHAARQANRNVRILGRHRQAFDHPINLYHPETDYLKSLMLWIE
ncbi:MAG: class I SAM-dependent rRNA methyltransferase [Patescibacteria group bacterium]